MKSKLSYVSLILLIGWGVLFWGCNSTPSPSDVITENYVKTHLSKLSNDDMRGRQALEEGAEEASRYISDVFNEIGLEPREGSKNYYQNFELHQYKPSSLSVTVDGKSVDKEHIIVVGGKGQISWNKDTPQVHSHVGKENNIGEAFSRVMQSNETMFITVDPVHTHLFNRYKRYLNRMNYTIGDELSTPKVMILQEGGVQHNFNVAITMGSQNYTLTNVIGTIPGKRSDEFVVYSAHYDHIGILKPVEGDSIANGADDNASGTVGVMALARYFKALPQPERTLLFVAFTGEEMGMLGSKYFAQTVNPDEIVAMINMEMIGKPSRFGPNSAFITGFDESDLGHILQHETENFGFEFHPDPYPQQNLFYRSDNATLARRGVPAHTISTDQIDIDSLYHTVDDEISSINFDHLTQTIRGIAKGTRPLTTGEATPQRVDPQRLN